MNVLACRAIPRDGHSFTPRNRPRPVGFYELLIFSVCILLASFSPASRATVAISHLGDTDPVTEGWSLDFPTSTVTGKPGADDLGAGGCETPCAYWRINDPSGASSTRGNYSYALNSAQFHDPKGWSFRARVRRIQTTTGVAEAPSYAAMLLLRSSNGTTTREFTARFGVAASGLQRMEVVGVGEFTLGPTSDYQLVEIVYDPDRDKADVLVDGKVVLADYTGVSFSANINTASWGSGSSAETAQTFWHEVVFETAPDTDGDGLADMDERRTYGTDPYLADSDDDGANDGEEIAAGSDPLDSDTDNDDLLDGFEIRYGMDPTTPDSAGTDTDADGLNSYEEQTAGSSPLLADTDGDGISDHDEVQIYKSNPDSTDSDGDGLADADEVNTYHTDPAKYDSDSDGLGDYDEIVVYHTQALDADSDDDGALDGHEIAHGTDPLDADSDDDGLLDGFEITYGFDPLVAGEQQLDPDGDGLVNLAEQAAHSDPNRADTDGDTLSDGEEVMVYHSDPTTKDTDGDGLSDDYEIAHGFAVSKTGDEARDADSDGLTNLEEQKLRTDPLDADTDDDGVIDGQEVLIARSNPLRDDHGMVAQVAEQGLMFKAENQPLFINPPPASRIDLLPHELIDEAMAKNNYGKGPNTYGKVVTVKGPVPLWAYQEAWDRGWATCKKTRTGSTQYNVGGVVGLFDACSNWSYTPSDSLCRDGGSIDLEAQSVSCCVTVAGDFNALASYDSCKDKSDIFRDSYVKNFSLAYVEGLYAGNQIPDTINVPRGLGTRPTQAPPPADYKAGAEVTTDVSMSADLVISAESQDPGQFDVDYITYATLFSDNSSVAVGDTFKVWAIHHPRADQSKMSSKWAAIGFTAGYEVTGAAKATAEYWSINPNKAASYPDPDFQEHGTMTILDDTRTESGEFVGFTAAASDRIEFRFMHGVNAEAIPDFMKDKTFTITPDIIDFVNPEVALYLAPGANPHDVIPPGTGLPISISRCVTTNKANPCPPSPCPFGFAIKGFCFGLGKAVSLVKNFFSVGSAQEMANLRFQLPEVNTPVSEDFWGGYVGDITDLFNSSIWQVKIPKRSAIEGDGSLVNTVPNGARPLINYTDTNALEALVSDTTLLSSDTMRFQWDLDGTFSSAGQAGWFDKSYGNSFVSIKAGLFDIDAAVWTGIDQTLTFKPGVVADVTFDKAVMVRRVSNDPALNEATATLLNPGDSKSIPVVSIADAANGVSTPQTWLEVTQPPGGVHVNAAYSFRDSTFTNDTERVVTVAPTLTILKAGIGGLVGGLISGAAGSAEIHGPRVTLPTPAVTKVALGDKFNAQGEVVDDQGKVIGARNVPGQTTNFSGGARVLSIVERANDTDHDGLPDTLEQAGCTSELDMDSDDDGIGDGIEDINRNGKVDAGETDPCNADTDGDGIQDGTEKGAIVGIADPDGSGPLLGTDPSVFVADSTPTVRSDPTVANVTGGSGNGGGGGGSGGGALSPTALFAFAIAALVSARRRTGSGRRIRRSE